MSRRKAQSTLEYITVFAAVVVAVLVFAYLKLRPAVEGTMNSAANKIKAAATTFNATDGEQAPNPAPPEAKP